ncbi:MAG TPA: DUF669 domain-containing protein [Phycisphaerae bacterium]|nr:DUF669 domain-containing protein [Phycisphaerae bacterium]HPM22960.1 DUF669 domain-containing protein [Phycisphaerae bacterium]
MAGLNNFNANDVDPNFAFDPIPPGNYTAVITASEMKPTKKGTGQYLELTFQVVEGEHKGRLLWARLNLDNPDAQAVKIARAELSAVCRAVGVLAPKDSVELHNVPLVLKVDCKNRKDTGEPANVIKSYASASAAAPRPATAGAANGKAPWQR